MPEQMISLVEESKAADVLGGSFSRRKKMSEDHKLESQKDKFCVDCSHIVTRPHVIIRDESEYFCDLTCDLVTGKKGKEYCENERNSGSCGTDGRNFKRK